MNISALISKIKENLFLLIPISCILAWSFYYLISTNFNINPIDFRVVYYAVRNTLRDPSELYKPENRFYYFPCFAAILALYALFPITIAAYLYYGTITVASVLYVIEFNRILILLDLKEKIHRLMFLLIISNGFFILYQYFMAQFKFLTALLILIVLRREIKYRNEEKERDHKFYFINFLLMSLATGIAPPMIFFLIIYIFNGIPIVEILKKDNIIRYVIFVLAFFTVNFLFIVYPFYILNIFQLYGNFNRLEWLWGIPILYLREWEWLALSDYSVLLLTSNIIASILAFLMILNRKLNIEQKFGYFGFTLLWFYAYAERSMIVLTPLILLTFIPFLNFEKKGIDFVKENMIALIGIISLAAIHWMPGKGFFFEYLPFTASFPFIIIIYIRWIVLLCFLTISIVLLQTRRTHQIKKK